MMGVPNYATVRKGRLVCRIDRAQRSWVRFFGFIKIEIMLRICPSTIW